MHTVQEMLTRALVDLSVVAAGETPEQHLLDSGVFFLQDMLDAWAIEGRLVPNSKRVQYTVTTAGLTYSIGPTSASPDIVGEFVEVNLVEYLAEHDTKPVPLAKVNERAISRFSQTDDGSRPSFYYFEPSFPTGTLRFNAKTVADDSFTISGNGYLVPEDLALGDTLDFPRGYFSAVRMNLAVDMAESHSVGLSQKYLADALVGKRRIKIRNMQSLGGTLPKDLPGLRGSNMLYPRPNWRY